MAEVEKGMCLTLVETGRARGGTVVPKRIDPRETGRPVVSKVSGVCFPVL